MLAYYVERFDTVELNNSFYHLPSEAAFEGWRRSTPPGFTFAVKGSRFITHMKKLKDGEQSLPNFIPRAELLAEKIGPILFQLPPHWKLNLERLEEFLSLLPPAHRYTFEFREHSWLTDETYSSLRNHNAAFCIYELDRFLSPLIISADWSYVRLHGPGAKYQGKYGRKGLQPWADWIREQRESLKAIYVYFDNDQAGYAVEDALMLKEMVR